MGVQVTCNGENREWRHATISFNTQHYSENNYDSADCPICELTRRTEESLRELRADYTSRINAMEIQLNDLQKMRNWWLKSEAVDAALKAELEE